MQQSLWDYRVHACDVGALVVQDLAAKGGIACDSPAQLAAACKMVVPVVTNTMEPQNHFPRSPLPAGIFQPVPLEYISSAMARTYFNSRLAPGESN